MKKVRKAVIPAAGLGTRFLPATIAQPKEMLVVVDKPVIQYVVEEAVASGIEEILIVTGRNKRAVEDHFDPPFELEDALLKKNKVELLESIEKISKLAHLHYVRQKKQLGLADAIYQAKYFIGDEPFVVLLGDTIISSNNGSTCVADMMKIYDLTGKSVVATEFVPEGKDISRYGVVKPKKGEAPKGCPECYELEDLIEKPEPGTEPSRMAVASRYIFDPAIFDYIEKTEPGKGGEIQITDSMRMLCKDVGLYSYPLNGKRYDIGNKVDYIKTNIEFALLANETKGEIKGYISDLASKLG
ncbi:MAG TPA: UTP--glucose-1-phosphate uridylyltransferase GalU [bacterium]|nr:UTP--glucose-1-phosphate uridylyltransferase GalU [bacterium]